MPLPHRGSFLWPRRSRLSFRESRILDFKYNEIGTSLIIYCTYILELSNGSYYVGSTNDLGKRLEYHKRGKVRSTKGKLPCVLNTKKYIPVGQKQSKENFRSKVGKAERQLSDL